MAYNVVDNNNLKSIYLSGILLVLILLISSRYSNKDLSKQTYYLLMLIFASSLVCLFVKMIKNYKESKLTIDSNKSNELNKLNESKKIKIVDDNNREIFSNVNDIKDNILEKTKSLEHNNKYNNKRKLSKRVRFNTPLKQYEILDNYQKDFFTFRDTLYQNTSNDFDYSCIMNKEHEEMDSSKKLTGKIWNLYDDLTKPDYSKIPVRYDKNIDNAKSNLYPVYFKGPVVRLT